LVSCGGFRFGRMPAAALGACFGRHAGLGPGMRLGARRWGTAALSPAGSPGGARLPSGWRAGREAAGFIRVVMPRGAGRTTSGGGWPGRECCALHASGLMPGRKAWACRGAEGARLEGREGRAGGQRASAEGGGRGGMDAAAEKKNANTDVSVFFPCGAQLRLRSVPSPFEALRGAAAT